MRKGGGIKDETAVKIADELGIERSEVLLSAVLERSSGSVKDTWEKISKKVGIAASVIMATSLAPSAFEGVTLFANRFGLCILCQIIA